MGPVQLISLGLLALVFILWAIAMFGMLYRLDKRSKQRLAQTGGGYFTGFGHSLAVFRDALTSDKDHKMRRRILILTGLMFLMIAVLPYSMAPSP